MESRPVVLASASPRRKALLQELVASFEVLVSEVDEEAITCDDPQATAERLAKAKAEAVYALRPESLVIGADTVVAYSTDSGSVMLAKPIDAQDAERMLAELSGRTHFVITGVAIISSEGNCIVSDRTDVQFRELSSEEIQDYVASGEPLDKAGAYAIQGGAASFVDRVEGSISNVIGLPIEKLRAHLFNGERSFLSS